MRKLINYILRLFKKRVLPEFNINHPDIAGAIEPAFVCSGVQYYRFTDEFKCPAGRYKYYYAYLREVDLRMELSLLKQLISDLKACLNASKKEIDLEQAWRILFNIEGRITLGFEPDTVKRLASVAYFDETEDLSTYSKEYGNGKIKKWESAGGLDFFLTKPIGELLGLNGISATSLAEYLETSNSIIANLNQELQNPSGEK